MTPWWRRAIALVAATTVALMLSGCVQHPLSPPAPTKTPAPAPPAADSSTAAPTPATPAEPGVAIDVPCTELLDPASFGYGSVTPPGPDGAFRPEDGVFPLDADVVSAMQAQVLHCTWTNGTDEPQYGPGIAVTALADRQSSADAAIMDRDSRGGRELGVGDRSSGDCSEGDGTVQCDADVIVGRIWFYLGLTGDPVQTDPPPSREQSMTALVAASRQLAQKLATVTPKPSWTAPASSWKVGADCSALGGEAQLKAEIGDGRWQQGDSWGDRDDVFSTAFDSDLLSCGWKAADALKNSDGTDPSFGMQVIPGGGWIWPHLGTGLTNETSTPIDIPGATAAAYRCYGEAASTYCWGEAVQDGSFIQLMFDYSAYGTQQKTAAALAAVVAGHAAG